MRVKGFFLMVGLLIMLTVASTSNADITAILGPGNEGITTFSFNLQTVNVDGLGNLTSIRLFETYTNNGYGLVQINGLVSGQNYVVQKFITNATGTEWTSFSNELLDPGVDAGDVATPSWVPAGFSRSNDSDGLSFAQGTAIPRASNFFASYVANELGGIDYIDFYNGTLTTTQDTMSFGLRDNTASANEPFLLAEKPNGRTTAAPEPATMLLMGLGLLGLAGLRRRK